MRRNRWIALFSALLAVYGVCALARNACATGITIGNVVVVRSLASTNGNAAAVELDEYLPATPAQGAPVSTIAIPTPAVNNDTAGMTVSGSAAEGFLKLSNDQQYLTLAGYAAPAGTAGITGTTAAATNRVVARVNASTMAVDTSTRLTDAQSGSNIRGAVSSNGTDIWTSGGGTGVNYATLGATTSLRVNLGGTGGTTRRVVGIFNNQLYVSAASTGGPNQSLNTVGTGLPTTN